MSYDFSGFTSNITNVVSSLSSSAPAVVAAALGIFGGILLFGIGVRWVKRMLHSGK